MYDLWKCQNDYEFQRRLYLFDFTFNEWITSACMRWKQVFTLYAQNKR